MKSKLLIGLLALALAVSAAGCGWVLLRKEPVTVGLVEGENPVFVLADGTREPLYNRSTVEQGTRYFTDREEILTFNAAGQLISYDFRQVDDSSLKEANVRNGFTVTEAEAKELAGDHLAARYGNILPDFTYDTVKYYEPSAWERDDSYRFYYHVTYGKNGFLGGPQLYVEVNVDGGIPDSGLYYSEFYGTFDESRLDGITEEKLQAWTLEQVDAAVSTGYICESIQYQLVREEGKDVIRVTPELLTTDRSHLHFEPLAYPLPE